MTNCYLCYEKNSPALASTLATCDNDGSIFGYRIMSTEEKAVAWAVDQMIQGIYDGYCTEEYPGFTELKNCLMAAKGISLTMHCGENSDSNRYDIVVELIPIE